MSRWFQIRNGDGDTLVATNGDGKAKGRFRFGQKDKEGRFNLETPTGQFVTIDDGGDIVLGIPSPGDARQLWSWGQGDQLINGQSGQAAAFVATAQGQKLTTRAPKTGEATQAWNVAASGPPDNTPVALFNSYTSDSDGNTFYTIAAIDGAQLFTGIEVVTAAMSPSIQGQLWFCIPSTAYPGYNSIVCAENPNLLLTATNAGPVYVAAPLVAPANPAFQLWAFAAQGAVAGSSPCFALINAATNQALTFGGSGDPLSLQALSSPLNSNQICGWTPGSPMDTILNEAPEPFPAFTGDQLAAYNYINSQLGGPSEPGFDLRTEYQNLVAPLSSYQDDVAGYTAPSGVSSTDWEYVKGQLNTELTAVIAVQLLFSNYKSFHVAAFTEQSTALNAIGANMSMSNSTNVNGVGTALLEGTIYTLLCAIPEIGGIVGNVFETGFNAALASKQVSTQAFQYQYSNLWSNLVPGFEYVLAQLGSQEQTILQDWGMTQNIYALILQKGGPDSLSWPADNSSAVTAATQGYSIAAMQMLMPTQYWIARTGGWTEDTGLPQNSPFRNYPPGWGWWSSLNYFGNVFCTIIPAGTATSQQGSYPPSSVLQDFANYGGVIADFYPSVAGYDLPTIIDGCFGQLAYPYGGWNYDTLLTTITNMSEYQLSVNLNAQEGSVEFIGNTTRTLGPYASIAFASNHTTGLGGLRIVVTIWTPPSNSPPSPNEGPVASFQLHLSDNDWSGRVDKIWVDSKNASNGFSFGSIDVQQAADSGEVFTCGSVTAAVFYVPT